MERLDFDADIMIDHTALDIEWIRQPDRMRKYALHAAATKRTADLAKERLDVIRAKEDASIRANPSRYGLEKITESAIQNAILLQPIYQEASEALNESRYEHEVALAAVRAMDQRKTALENLVRLLGMSYFAGPQAPRDLSEEFLKQAEERSNEEMNRKIQMRRRQKPAE